MKGLVEEVEGGGGGGKSDGWLVVGRRLRFFFVFFFGAVVALLLDDDDRGILLPFPSFPPSHTLLSIPPHPLSSKPISLYGVYQTWSL
jgi:hypothetical protein